ncbi:ketopantoate reductase family protein [Niallia endozanthoxylica]|uniref:2-dehydropantoate 2-reductase n=1 Tax=Niallia endozanthoxylica TaxID=2036016 RepID=A0A5J5HTF1_9BACI|nr:ketopantoate reductase family protein [Niallia endozanthoxylica]KAA9023616.1 ketopantoate reductase family protein [Niallia endozanthoxylica]
MKEIKKVTLVGLGAIGTAYGSLLHDSLNESFQVVASEERIKRYETKGILINNEPYHFNYITPEAKTGPADLVIFAVKNDELPQAIKDVRHHIGSDTIILSLLNGISSEEEIYAAYRNEHILYSMSVEIDAVRTNNEVHFTTRGRIEYGELDNTLSNDVLAVKKLFEKVGIDYEISSNITHTMWWKFMINVGINQTSAVLKAPYGIFQTMPIAYEWVESAMREVVALSEKIGTGLTEQDIKKFWPIINKLSPKGKTSMLQDVEAGRKTEVEYFAGKVCELGEKYKVPTPINEQLYRMITIIEEMTKINK